MDEVLYIVLWGSEELLRGFAELYMLMVYFEYPQYECAHASRPIKRSRRRRPRIKSVYIYKALQ
jgi:hypothetical protein